jgi:surface antigen
VQFSKGLTAILVVSLLTQGCATQDGDTNWYKPIMAAGGAVVGVVAAKLLAESDAKRLKLTSQDKKKREAGYIIAFGLAGGVLGAKLGDTLFAKLKEDGKKKREQALLNAVTQAKIQHYDEPTEPTLTGTVTPGAKYMDLASNRECQDMEDSLKDATSSESIYVKYCRSLPNGGWQPTTT